GDGSAGRAPGRGHHGPIGVEPGCLTAIEHDLHPDQAEFDAPMDHEVIECRVQLGPALHARLQDGALLDQEVTGLPAVDGRLQVFHLDLHQEAEPAEVHPRHRDAGGGGLPGRPQQRAIATEAHQQASAVQVAAERVRHVLPGGAMVPNAESVPVQVIAGCPDRRQLGVNLRMVDESDRLGHAGLSWMKNSRLPLAPAMGEEAWANHWKPMSAVAWRRVRRTSSCCAGSRTTPPFPTRPLPTSNWGLTRAMRSPGASSNRWPGGG